MYLRFPLTIIETNIQEGVICSRTRLSMPNCLIYASTNSLNQGYVDKFSDGTHFFMNVDQGQGKYIILLQKYSYRNK